MNSGIIIRDLEPKDAAELSALFRRCYGKTYGSSVFYNVDALAELISKRELISTIATKGQQIVGHIGITVRHHQSKVCETGNTVVDPSARGQGLMLRLGAALHELVKRNGYVAYLHFPTTAHDVMQKASVAYGGQETGVMLAYIPKTTTPETTTPETTDTKLKNNQPSRLAATVAYQPLSSPPTREVILPKRYRMVITSIYENLSLNRRINAPSISVKQSHTCDVVRIIENYNDQRGLLHIFVETACIDIAEKVSVWIKKYQPKVTHIDLPLDNPDIDIMIENLREIGFFFSAVLPEFAHTDLLRLQAISPLMPDNFNVNVINKTAIRLTDFIRQDANA